MGVGCPRETGGLYNWHWSQNKSGHFPSQAGRHILTPLLSDNIMLLSGMHAHACKRTCVRERDEETKRNITSHLEAGNMCLFFSYQCLSTTFPACDWWESMIMNQLNLHHFKELDRNHEKVQLNVFKDITVLLNFLFWLVEGYKRQLLASKDIHSPSDLAVVN